jgi:hypothetical protein
MIKNYIHLKYPLFLLYFNKTRPFSKDFSKNTPVSNFMKIRRVVAELFHADGQTHSQTKGRRDRQADMTKLNVTLRNFSKAAKERVQTSLSPDKDINLGHTE